MGIMTIPQGSKLVLISYCWPVKKRSTSQPPWIQTIACLFTFEEHLIEVRPCRYDLDCRAATRDGMIQVTVQHNVITIVVCLCQPSCVRGEVKAEDPILHHLADDIQAPTWWVSVNRKCHSKLIINFFLSTSNLARVLFSVFLTYLGVIDTMFRKQFKTLLRHAPVWKPSLFVS